MKLFSFEAGLGRSVGEFDSTGFILSRVAHLPGETVVHCAWLDPGGAIGYHPAGAVQLFLVVEGEGWVRGESPEQIPVHAGQAALWQKGEWHAAGTQTGMTAVILEGDDLDPEILMPPV